MQKPINTTFLAAIAIAVFLGMVGGGVMGGLAGYYAAQSSLPVPVEVPVTENTTSSPQPLLQAAPPVTTNLTLKEDSAIIDAVRKAKPFVVTIINRLQSDHSLFGGSSGPTASGSGVIVDARGYIVTNNHVIDGEKSLQVIFSDGTKVDATIVGTDAVADIAVLKVNAKVPAVAQLGDSDAVEPGQTAIAIGSPLGDFRGTVTVGVVSALNRKVGKQQGLIQTDAAINNGNSGGPLINSLGQVIGITTLVVRSTSEGNIAEGLGFAIPSNVVRDAVNQLIAKGRVDRAYIGVGFQEMDPQLATTFKLDVSQGVVVTQVDPDSPAAKAGIQQSDVILSVDSASIDQDLSLGTILMSHKVGDHVTLTVLRDGKQLQVQVTLVARPAIAGP